MTDLINKKKKIILPSQNKYLPIILWLFPLFLLNIGWYSFSYIDYRWVKNEWIEQSQREVETLAATSDFSYSMGKISGEFFDSLKKEIKTFDKKNSPKEFFTNIASEAKKVFKKPFPEHNLFVFKMLAKNNKAELISSNVENIVGKRALGVAFEFLVRINLIDKSYSENEKKIGSSMAKKFLGSNSNPSVMAETQRGKVSYSIYNNKPHYFLWDYFKDEKTSDIYGLFLTIENNVNAEIGSKLIALRGLKYDYKDGIKRYGAFIPLFPGYGGVIANEEFAKMPEFKKFTREWTPKNIYELYDWQFKDTTKLFENTRVGDFQAFFYILAGQSHAAVLLKPILEKPEFPYWLYLLNIVSIIIIIIILIRGFILGIWPSFSLKIRFITTYFLAASMPLGLLVIATYGFISEYEHSARFKDLSKLRLSINLFDTRKTQLQEEYKNAYLEIMNDSHFQECIKNFDKANTNNPSSFPDEAKDVLNRALEILNKNSRHLPILGLTIVDERGNYFSNYGNEQCQVFKTLDGNNEYKSKVDLTQKETISKDINDKAVNLLMYSFLKPMRDKILKAAPKTKKWDEEYTPTIEQETVFGGFRNAAGGHGDLTKALDEHRSMAMDRLVGDRIISHIYDNIFIDGIPRFVIYFTWDVAELDKESFESSLHYFALKEPNFVFFAFKSKSSGLEPLIDPGRHEREFMEKSESLAEDANLRGNSVSRSDDKMSMIAVPSKKYKDTIIVGGVSPYYLQMEVFNRKIICASIIAIATIIILFCIYYSFKIFLSPIGNLKQVLDKVADGNLDVEIKSSSKDEFGVMSHEFSVMTRELYERNKLATLLSDHAVEALSKHEYSNGVNSDVERFKGTALVTDIRNFTGMCEKYEPEQITELLNEHFACMTKIFATNGGRIYKYIGDAIEVVFSDNDDFEKNSVERAFISSVEMLEALKKINKERIENNLFEYKIGVGLCYSTMSSGSIGSLETRLDYAILGDALKNAAKLESMSKLNPEFPLIVDGNFISSFKNIYDNINFSFIKMEDGIEGYKVDDSCREVLPGIVRSNENKKPERMSKDDFIKKDNASEKNKTSVDSYEIEENISFVRKLIIGSMFILLFISVLTLGIYFTNKYKKDFKKNELIANNQIINDQMLGDHFVKVAFDSKCRVFAGKLQEKINESERNGITDEIISNTLKDYFNSDLSIKGLGFNTVFVRLGNYNDNDIKVDDLSTYLSRILPVYPVGNIGYSVEELKLICDTYRIIHLNYNGIINSKLEEKLKSKYENISKIDFRDKLIYFYENPCKKVFGDKIVISRLDGDLRNTTTDAVIRGEDCFLYTLNFFQNNKQIGYLVMSIPVKNAYKSIPFILSAFSKNNENIILRNVITNECHFSESIPEYVRNKIKNIIQEGKTDKVRSEIVDYLNSVGCVLIQENAENQKTIIIDNQPYEIFLVGLFGQNNILSILDYLIIGFTFFILLWVLKGILRGETVFNKFISAKLWLALLIVAVIPVLTVFFVPSLFLNEYLSVKNSLKRGEMQRFMGIYERKMDFFMPILSNDLKKKNQSADFNKYIYDLNNSSLPKEIRKESLKQLRSLLEYWVDKDKFYSSDKEVKSKEKALLGYKYIDVIICGKGGWSFSLSEKKEKDSIEDRPVSLNSMAEKGKDNKGGADNIFGSMIKIIAKSLLDQKLNENDGNKVNSNTVFNELAAETSLDTARILYGDDTFIKLSHGINIVTLFDIGFGKMGIMIGALPDYKNPKAIVVWVINFANFYYLEKNIDKVESDYKLFIAENFRYGIVAKQTDDNNLRIPIGGYGSWIAATNLPISANIELNKEKYLLEGVPALKQFNSLLISLFPEKEFIEEVNRIAYAFYFLLTLSLIIIIFTAKNIADDIINPVNALIYGIKEVNRENFSFRINSDRTDELGILCLSFDKMTKGLDEKRMMSRMLSKTATMVTLNEETSLSGKTDAVLMYIGIPKFSKVMKELGDYEVFEQLKNHTSVMAGIIMDKGGEIDKIIGEKMLVVFRVNNNESEIAMAAYRAAKQILELERTNQLSFSISIGLNYGKVINGFLGVGNKRDFTVIGDPVNVTARIESLAESLESNRCVVSDTFYGLLNGKISVKAYGEVELKGKSQPMKVYNLL